MTDPMFNIYSKGDKMTTYRVPLEDICAGPKCRFITNQGEAGGRFPYGSSIPCIYYFYDKVEQRTIKHKHREKVRHWLRWREVEVEREESVCYYHIVEILYEPYWTQDPYCISFHTIIAKARRWGGRKTDEWLCDLTDFEVSGYISCNYHQWIPIEKIGSYKEPEPKWQDGAKCPSFLPYPIAT